MSRVGPKKRRDDDPSGDNSSLRALGDGVYQVRSTEETCLTVGDGDLYKAFKAVGTAIIDNSADLGRFQDGILLQADSKFYLGFNSPSSYSVMQLSSSLQLFHDRASQEFIPFVQQLDMVKSVKNAQPSTHLCIRFDFSPSTDDYFSGASETLDAVGAFINRVVRRAITNFKGRYVDILPSQYPPEGTLNQLSTFLDWLATTGTKTKLFIAVHQAHQVLQRPVDASYWAQCRSAALGPRLALLRRLLLQPIWSNFGSKQGVVRKFLIAGPHFVSGLFYPLSPAGFKDLPAFLDLTDCNALHGFTSPQIRTIYSLSPPTMPREKLLLALRHCNMAVSPADSLSLAREFPGIYTKESLQSVLPLAAAEPSVLDEDPTPSLSVYKAYLGEAHDAAARALYPLLLRNVAFRRKIEGMLRKKSWVLRRLGPVFSLDDLIQPEPEDEQLLTRVFMLGLMPGGCARALLTKLCADTRPETYSAKYRFRERSLAYIDRGLTTAQLALDVSAFDILALTEQSIATLILDYFRPLQHYKQLPTREETFQGIMLQLQRAALLQIFGHSAFVNEAQIEVAFRHHTNLFGDLILKITIGGVDYIIIHEYKSFDPAKTMNGTHARIRLPRTDTPRLRSQDLRDERTKMEYGRTVEISERYAWYQAMQHFLRELASIRDLPPHWYFDPLRETVDLAKQGCKACVTLYNAPANWSMLTVSRLKIHAWEGATWGTHAS
ncbi:hypothetical protein AURDEDRAFT_162591 [Auricularia subglabra TFB-10046 SS5]|nr:hypothetical protein AURDEDRAFT_162591 [Auricularia subglabra TFB-10046 SS5]